MGSSEVGYFPEQKQEENLTYGEVIRRLCPDYLAMGMTLSEYYDGDPDDLASVREAYKLVRKQKNFDAWLQGFYVYHAMQCVSPLYRDLVKDHQPEKYLNEPLDLFPENKPAVEEQRIEDQKDLENQAKVRAWAERVNRLRSEKNKEACNG